MRCSSIGAMDATELDAVLTDCGVSPAIASQLVGDGWNLKNFRTVVSDVSEFEHVWDQLFTETLPLVQKASIRAAWRHLQVSSEASLNPTAASSMTTPPVVEGSWSESFPPKIQSSKVAQLKKQFLEDYPSEVLSAETMPSSRLLSLAFQQQQKGEPRWIPWKYRMTQSRMEDLAIYQRSKIPKIEGVQLHSLILDEPPSIEISNQGMGTHAIRSMMEVHNIALALVDSCHLQRLKAYTLRFIGFLTQRFDNDSNLRTANVLEAQSADKQLWQVMYDLVVDEQWSLNDALNEVTVLRSDMASLLQPRPKTQKVTIPPTLTPHQPGGGKGKGKGKGKAGIKGKRADPSGKPTWVTEAHIGGKKMNLCMMYQSNTCQRGDQCRFGHFCAFPLANGQACGQKHSDFSLTQCDGQ